MLLLSLQMLALYNGLSDRLSYSYLAYYVYTFNFFSADVDQ